MPSPLGPPPPNPRLLAAADSSSSSSSAHRARRSLSPSSVSTTSVSSTSSVDVEHATISLSSRPVRTGSIRQSSALNSAPSTSTAAIAATSLGDEIEMGQLGTPSAHSHRRRRSSLVNELLPGHSNGRNRAGSVHQGSPHKSKISEEGENVDLDDTAIPKLEESDLSDSSDVDLNDDEETGLTKRERRKRRERRLRNAQLDQRIARGEQTSLEEKKEADHNVVRRLVVNSGLIGLWYLFSLSISLYNKWMFGDGKLNFPFPLFTTAFHMFVQFSLASLVLHFFPQFRPENGITHRHGHASDRGRSRHEAEPADKSLMTRWFYWTRIGPCGAATGLDIGLGNASLKFITLSFYTMCKSSALAFVLFFAFLFHLETPTWRLVAVIATMTLGVVMMVAGEVEFSLSGFILVISAAFFSGFRWALTQILLLRNPATSNPFSSIFYLAPIMFLTLTLIALPSEGLFELFAGVAGLAEKRGAFVAPFILLLPGTIAFAMTASEFALLQRTSVVTLSIAGIFKEVVTISAAALVYDDSLTPINFSGLVVTIGAICAYNWIKISKMREEAQNEVHRDHLMHGTEGSPRTATGESSGSGSEGDEEEERRGLMGGLRPTDTVNSEADIILTPSSVDPDTRA